jgi:hypothetical protein
MPLDFQIIQAPFRSGLAEGTDPHQVPFGTLVAAKNARWDTTGRMGKRYGTSVAKTRSWSGFSSYTSVYPASGTLSSISRLFACDTELCAVSDGTLYGFSDGDTVWRRRGPLPSCPATWTDLATPEKGVTASDSAIYGDLVITAWQEGPLPSGTAANIFVQVFNTKTQNLVVPARAVASVVPSTATSVFRVVVIGATAFIVVDYNGNINAYTLNLSTYAVAGPTLLRNNPRNTTNSLGFDAVAIGSLLVIGYETSGAVISFYSYNTSLVQQATGTLATAPGTDVRSLSMSQSGTEDIYVGYWCNSLGAVRAARVGYLTMTETVAAVSLETVAEGHCSVLRYDATGAVLSYNVSATPDYCVTRLISTVCASVALTRRQTTSASLITRPFFVGSRVYIGMVDTGTSLVGGTTLVKFTNSYIVEYEPFGDHTQAWPHRYAHRVDPFIGGWYSAGFPTNVPAASSTRALVPLTFQIEASTTYGFPLLQGLRLVSVMTASDTYAPGDMWRSWSFGQESYISGGMLAAYDGKWPFDYGFSHPPHLTATTAVNAGGSIAAGAYIYTAISEYKSAAGMMHRSQQTVPVSVTAPGSSTTVTFTVANIGLSAKVNPDYGSRASSSFVFYRSTVGGSQPYRLTIKPTLNLCDDATMSATNTVTFTDVRADADAGDTTPLSVKPVIYTTGGILEDGPMPSFTTHLIHAKRIFGVDGTQKTIWYSKSFDDDSGVAPGFHPGFRILMDTNVTALATMDDKLVIFAADRLWYMLGSGPAPNGVNSDFTNPIVIQSDVGCVNPKSVVSTPYGVAFLSSRGLYQLSRGLEVAWIGRPVKDTLADYPTVTSAVLVSGRNEVRWTCSNSGGTESVVIAWNFIENQWTTHEYTLNDVARAPIADACMWNGVYTIALTTGYVYTEDSTTYLDEGDTWVPLDWTTSWSHASGPLAFQSVRSFMADGTSHSNHRLSAYVGFDNDEDFQQGPRTWAEGTRFVTESGETMHAVLSVGKRRKCFTIRFRMVDAAPNDTTNYPIGTGQGPSFEMMGIEVGIKRGLSKVTAGQAR